MIELTQEKMIFLKRKYGQQKLRKVFRYYSSNIPEKYWFVRNGENEQSFKKNLAKMNNAKSLCVLDQNIYNSNRYVFKLTQACIDSNKVAFRYDYNVLLSKAINPFGKMNFDNLYSEFNELDLLVITGIKFGDVFDKNQEVFMNLITMLTESVREKALLFSIEEPVLDENEGDVEEKLLESAYGEFGKLLNSKEVEKYYLRNE